MSLRVKQIRSHLHGIWLLSVITIFLIGLSLIGCAEVNYLRDAQSSFSEAARLENQRRMATVLTADPSHLLLTENEIRAGYASAISSINSLNSNQVASLKSDKLWGVALTIKAMSYWRLGDYDKMNEVIRQANADTDQLFPRDQALLEALPGLRRIDEASALVELSVEGISDQQKKARLADVERLLDNANTALNQALKSVPEHPAVRAYLFQAILAGYKTRMDSYQRFTAGRTLSDKELETVVAYITDLDCSFKRYLSEKDIAEARSQVIGEWQKRFGLPDRDLSCRQ